MFAILAAIYPYYVVRDAALQEGSLYSFLVPFTVPLLLAWGRIRPLGNTSSARSNLTFLLRNWVEARYISELAVKRSGFQFGLRYTVEFNLGRHFQAG